MKKTLLAIILSSGFILSQTALAATSNAPAIAKEGKELKIGILDFQRIVEKSKMAKDMNKKIEDEFKPRHEKILAAQNALQDKLAELKKNQAILSESQNEKMQEEVINKRREVERLTEDFQRDLQQAQAKASKQFSEKVQTEVDKIGKEEKFDLIIQKAAVVYSSESFDVTDKVLKKIN